MKRFEIGDHVICNKDKYFEPCIKNGNVYKVLDMNIGDDTILISDDNNNIQNFRAFRFNLSRKTRLENLLKEIQRVNSQGVESTC